MNEEVGLPADDIDPAAFILALAGLSPEERDLYLVVTDHGTTDHRHVARIQGVSDDIARARLDALREQGYLSHHAGVEARYAAVDPRSFLPAAADALSERSRAIRDGIGPLFDRYERAHMVDRPASDGETVLTRDPRMVAGWYAQLQHEAMTSVLVFDRPPYISEPMVDLERHSLSRGVEHRAIYTLDSLERGRAWDDIQASQRAGERSRLAPDLPMKLVLADEAAAVVCLSLQPGVYDALLTRSAPLVSVLTGVFEEHWQRSAPLSADRDTPAQSVDAGIDAQGRLILSLLAAGATDEQVADRLSLSTRSVRRRIAQLMRDLGAVNRLQLGVLAGRFGLI